MPPLAGASAATCDRRRSPRTQSPTARTAKAYFADFVVAAPVAGNARSMPFSDRRAGAAGAGERAVLAGCGAAAVATSGQAWDDGSHTVTLTGKLIPPMTTVGAFERAGPLPDADTAKRKI